MSANKIEAKITKRRLAGSYLSSLISISLVLMLFGIACILLVNAKAVSDYLKENVRVTVLFNNDVSDLDARTYCEKLSNRPYVKGVEFVSKEQGEEEMKVMLGEDFMDVFTTSPIPPSIEMTLPSSYMDKDSLEIVRKKITASPLVSEVVYQESLIDALNRNLRTVAIWIGVFLVLLMVISFAQIGNTVRLSVYSKRFTVHTMKLVGATKAFIRRPFLVRSVLQGFLASLLASLAMGGGLFLIKKEFSMLFEIFQPKLLVIDFAMVLIFGILICLVCTFFVVNRLVSFTKDELYYK